jgi:lipoprotein Spr
MKYVPRFVLFSLILLTLLTSCRGSRSNPKNGKEATETSEMAARKAFAAEYSRKLGIPVPEMANQLLYTTLYDWMGVPYIYGGNNKKGVDCSGLICSVFTEVYNKQLPRVSAQMYQEAKKINEKDLKEGDLVFFKINTREVSHSGIFLFNDYFVHSTTSKGVIISRLNDTYWRKYFVGGGRFSQ